MEFKVTIAFKILIYMTTRPQRYIIKNIKCIILLILLLNSFRYDKLPEPYLKQRRQYVAGIPSNIKILFTSVPFIKTITCKLDIENVNDVPQHLMLHRA